MKASWKQWMKRRSVRNWSIVTLIFLVLALLQLVGSSGVKAPYDIESVQPNGAKWFVMLMQEAGAKVVKSNLPEGRTAVILRDTLTREETDDVQRWVERGGTLIVADPYSSFHQGRIEGNLLTVPSTLEPHCSTNFLGGVRRIAPEKDGNEYFFHSDLESDAQCFPAGGKKAYFLQQRLVGRGQLIELGGSDIFTNDRLDKADNSVLVTNLLRPSAGNVIAVLDTRTPQATDAGSKDVGLSSLVSPGVRDAFWLLFAAAALFMLWNARRLGRPIDEEPLVRIPASQLVVATGNLLELADQPRAAAEMLAADFRRSLSDRFGIRMDAENQTYIDLVSLRTGMDGGRLALAFQPERVASNESLVAYAQHLERLQQEVKNVR